MRTDEDGEAWNVLAGALIGGLVNLVTSAASETINYFSAEKSDRLSMGQIAAIVGVSTAIGAAEGAAIAAVPSAAIPISAAAGAAEAAITSLISRNEKTSGKDILTDTIIAGALGAAAGGGGSDFVKGGKVLNEARIGSITKATKGVSMKAKKTARHAIRKAKKYVAKSWMCSQLESFAYAGMNKFSTWFTEKWIDGISGR